MFGCRLMMTVHSSSNAERIRSGLGVTGSNESRRVSENNSRAPCGVNMTDLNDCLDVVDWLSKNGIHPIKVNYIGRTLKHLITLGDGLTVTDWQTQNGTDITALDRHGFTLAHVAAAVGDLVTLHDWILRYENSAECNLRPDLLSCIPNRSAQAINIRDKSGYTPAHLAAIFGRLDVLKVLSDNGANMQARGADGYTLLHLAALCGHVDVSRWLTYEGGDVNSTSSSGWSILQVAALTGRLSLVQYLVEKGGEISVLDKFERNLAHLAAARKHLELVVWLTDNGIKVYATDRTNRDVYNYLYDPVGRSVARS